MQTLLRVVVDGVETTISDIYEALPRAVIISLFSWRRAESNDVLPSTDRMGWWGDTYPPVENDRIGSRLWLLTREKITADTIARAKEYAEQALQWMLDDKVAASVTVEVERQGLDRVAMGIRLVRGDLSELDIRFADLWNHLTHDRSVLPMITLAPLSVSHVEGQSGTVSFDYALNRSPPAGISRVNYAVVGTGASPANAADFVGGELPSGTITFSDGQASANISVLVAGDTTYELDETFDLVLSNAVNARLLTPTAQGAILTDELDPYWSQTDFLVHFDSPSIVDVKGHSITVNGSAALTSAASKFGGSSLYLPNLGTNGAEVSRSWLLINNGYEFGAGGIDDCTAECWVRADPAGGTRSDYDIVLGQFSDGVNGSWGFRTRVAGQNNLTVTLRLANTWYDLNSGINAADGQFHHCALVHSGNDYRWYVDFVLRATLTNSNKFGLNSQSVLVGTYVNAMNGAGGNRSFRGWVDDARMTFAARYSGASFSPITDAFPES